MHELPQGHQQDLLSSPSQDLFLQSRFVQPFPGKLFGKPEDEKEAETEPESVVLILDLSINFDFFSRSILS